MAHLSPVGPLIRSPPNLPEILQFMQLLWAVMHGIEKTSKRMSSDIDVTAPQRLVQRVVGLFSGVSAGDLAAALHVHPSTLTRVLQRLVAQRLLRRDDPRDRRRAILRLTARGARGSVTARGTIESAVAETLRDVTSRERAATRRVLERLAGCLEPSLSGSTSGSSRSGKALAPPHRRRRVTDLGPWPALQEPLAFIAECSSRSAGSATLVHRRIYSLSSN